MYLGAVFGHGVVVEASLRPELFVALLAPQGILELQGLKVKTEEEEMKRNDQEAHSYLLSFLLDLSI